MDFDVSTASHPCHQCSALNPDRLDRCWRCGRALHSTAIRIRGAIALVLGLLLTGGMIYLMWAITILMRHSNDPAATTRFTGGATAATGIFALLSLVLSFGLVSIAMGSWMLCYGWRNPRLKRVVFLFAGIFWLIALFVRIFT